MATGNSIIARVLKRVLHLLRPGIKHDLHCGVKTVYEAIVDLWNAVIETQNVVNKNAEEMESFSAEMKAWAETFRAEVLATIHGSSVVYGKPQIDKVLYDGAINADGGTAHVSSLTWHQSRTTRYSDGTVQEDVINGNLETPGVSLEFMKLEGVGEVDASTGAVTAPASTNTQPSTAAVVLPRIVANGVASDDAVSERVTVGLGAAYLRLKPNSAFEVTAAGGKITIPVEKSKGAEVNVTCEGATSVTFDEENSQIVIVIPSGAAGATFSLNVNSNLTGFAELTNTITRKPQEAAVMIDGYYGYVKGAEGVTSVDNVTEAVMSALNSNTQEEITHIQTVQVHTADHLNAYNVDMPEYFGYSIAYFLLANNGSSNYKMVNCQQEYGGDVPVSGDYGYVNDELVTYKDKQYRLYAFVAIGGGQNFNFAMKNK